MRIVGVWASLAKGEEIYMKFNTFDTETRACRDENEGIRVREGGRAGGSRVREDIARREMREDEEKRGERARE